MIQPDRCVNIVDGREIEGSPQLSLRRRHGWDSELKYEDEFTRQRGGEVFSKKEEGAKNKVSGNMIPIVGTLAVLLLEV